MYEIELLDGKITIRPSLGTIPSTAAGSKSRDHTTHGMDVDDFARNGVHNAPVNESNAGPSSQHVAESAISEAFGLVKLSSEDFNKLARVMQRKQDNLEEKYLRKNVRNPKKTASAKRALWRMMLEVEEAMQVTKNRLLNGMKTLLSEVESDTDDEPSYETNMRVAYADETVERQTPFNQLVPSPMQMGTVLQNPATSEERNTETKDFTAEMPPSDELMNTNPTSVEPIHSSTTEDESPLSETDHVGEVSQIPTSGNSVFVDNASDEVERTIYRFEMRDQGKSTPEEDENPFTQIDCTGTGPKSATSEQSENRSVEQFDEDLDSSVCKFDDDDENTNASSLVVHEDDDYAEVESTIYRFESDASDDGGMETDACPSNVQDEEIMESVSNGISTSVETNLSAEKNCGERPPVLDDTGFSEGSDVNDTSGQSEFSNEEMDAERRKLHLDEEEKTEIGTLDQESNIIDGNPESVEPSALLVSVTEDSQDMKRHKISDNEKIEQNEDSRENEIVNINPKSVESVQSSGEDNSSPVCQVSTESLVSEVSSGGIDLPGTIAEITTFEQPANLVEEDLDVERYTIDEDGSTEMDLLVPEGETVDTDPKSVESSSFSVQKNKSLACDGLTQLVREKNCGIENVDLFDVIPEVVGCVQYVNSIEERPGIPDDNEEIENSTVPRRDTFVDIDPQSIEFVLSTDSLVQQAPSDGIDDFDLPGTIAEITTFEHSASPIEENSNEERCTSDEDESTEMDMLIPEGETVDADPKSVEPVEFSAEDSFSQACEILTHQSTVQKANSELDDVDSSDAITKTATFEKSDCPAVDNSNEEENMERPEIHDEDVKTEKNTAVLEDGIADVNPKSAGSGEISVESVKENGSLTCRGSTRQLPVLETNGGILNDDPFATIPGIDEFEQCDVDVLENTCAEVERKVDSIIQSLENDIDRDDEALPLTKSISSSIQESRSPTSPVSESIVETKSPNLNAHQDDEIMDGALPSAESTDLLMEENLMGNKGDVESAAGPSTPVLVDVLTPAVDESDVNCEIDDLTNLSSAAAPIGDEYEYMGDSTDCDEVINLCCSVSESVKREPAPKDADVDRSVTISLTVKSQKGKKRQRDDSSDDESVIEEARKTCDDKPRVKRKQLEDDRSDEEVEIFVERPEKRKRSPSINSSSDDESCTSTRAGKKQRTSPSVSNFVSDEAAVSTAGKGRKNIRQIMSDEELGEETREMGKKEEARREFVDKRKILLDQLEEPGASRKRLVLDYRFETKEVIIEVHPRIVEKLKPHQADGIRFMFDACYESVERAAAGTGGGCILAHSMGLGKTLQAIALIHTVLSSDKIDARTALVLCPLSVIPNWIAEFKEWLADVENRNDIRIFDIQKHKTNEARVKFLKDWQTKGGVLILNYEMFKQLVDPPAKQRPALKHSQQIKAALLNPGPNLVVCDEGHILKNDKKGLSKATMMIKTSRRILLTGTPLQNDLKEYYSLINFVKPHFLGTKEQFINRFVNPITNGQYKDSKPEDVALMKSRNYILNRKTGGIVQRFDYSYLTPYLEPKYEFVISVGLSDLQARLYQYYLDNKTSATAMGKSAGQFAHHSALQLLCNHPLTLKLHADRPKQKKKKKANENDEEEVDQIIDSQWWRHLVSNSDVESASCGPKLILLLAIIRHCQQRNEKLLVFSSSIPTLDMIEHFLQQKQFGGLKKDQDYYRADGEVPSAKRTKYFADFNGPSNKKVQLLLITTGVGGLGINLTAANRVIIFDANWNPSKDSQSVYRVFRLGQKKPCYIYRFVAQGTMEEKIYKRQITKLSVACRVVDKQQIERHYLLKNISELYEFDRKMPTGEVFKLPNDHVLAELLKAYKELILSYHEHDSLLENKPEEDLTDETKLAAWEHYEVESALLLKAPAPGGEKKPAGKDDAGCSATVETDAPVVADVGSSSMVDQDRCSDLSTRIETKSETHASSEGNRNDALLDSSVPAKSLVATNVESEAGLMAVKDCCYSAEVPTETSSETDVGSKALSVAPTQDEDVHENLSEQTAAGSVAPPFVELLEDRDDDTFSEPPGETRTWLPETDDIEPATSSVLESEDQNDASGTDAGSEMLSEEPKDPVVDVLEVGSTRDHPAESDLPSELEGQKSVPDIGAVSTDEGPQEEKDDKILRENVESDDSENDVKVVDDASATNVVESNGEVENDTSFSLLTFGKVNEPAQELFISEEFIMPNGFGAVEESPFLDMRQKCRWW